MYQLHSGGPAGQISASTNVLYHQVVLACTRYLSFGYVYMTFPYLTIAIQQITSPSPKKQKRNQQTPQADIDFYKNTPKYLLEVPEWRSVRPDVDGWEPLTMASNHRQGHIKTNKKRNRIDQKNKTKQTGVLKR